MILKDGKMERWKWIINNQDTGVVVNIKQDSNAYITFENSNKTALFDGIYEDVDSILSAINVKFKWRN